MSGNRAWSWRQAILESDLQPTTRHVLLTLSCYMNSVGGGCYPTTKTLHEATGLSERAVCTHLQKAADAGWLKVKKHGFGDRRWRSNEYKADWPETAQGTERGSAPQHDEALNVVPRGTEPNDNEALNDVQSILPNKHSTTSVGARASASDLGGSEATHVSFVVAENPKFVTACLAEWSELEDVNHRWKGENKAVSIPRHVVERVRQRLDPKRRAGARGNRSGAGEQVGSAPR